ncbi:endonuclease/exonuclease/phosphatase family protein [Nocardioides sp. SYSU DS0651]|uniref:endonuclease/exonuclease/phosphatase family protein n=1 Tax=Nocardioides sp. SYSU DS0651 TaxID=3415955 RepID=UPI003F4BA509
MPVLRDALDRLASYGRRLLAGALTVGVLSAAPSGAAAPVAGPSDTAGTVDTAALAAAGLAARPGGHCPYGPPCGHGHGGGDGDGDRDGDRDGDPREPEAPQPPPPPSVKTVGQVSIAHANIPMRSGKTRFRRGMRQLLAGRPEFVTLNEQFNRSVGEITRVADGYRGFRVTKVPSGRGGREALSTVVLWKGTKWRLVRGGRIRLVNDDRARHGRRLVVWDRYATWVKLRSRASGEVVSVVSVHHMTNPGKYGPNKAKRQRAYRVGMNRLVRLTKALGRRGPVLVGGDFNVHAGQRQGWTAVTKMRRAGYQWHAAGVDYLFYPAARGLRLMESCTLTHGRRISDHPFLVGRIALNATGARQRARSVC